MGRKRTKHDVQGIINDELMIYPLDLKEDDGLYPFSRAWSWRPHKGKHSGRVTSLTIHSGSATRSELYGSGHPHRLFYSEFNDEFPWAVNALGRGLKTICLEKSLSAHEGSYYRNSVGMFLDFCRRKNIALRGYEDLSFMLLCEWRADLRSVEMDSRYKATMFRRCCSVIRRIMGTDLMPSTFAVPVYSSDAPTPLAPYSDAVMFQLISAVTSDIESLMNNASEYSLVRENPDRYTAEMLHDENSLHTGSAYCEDLSSRNIAVNPLSPQAEENEVAVPERECRATDSSAFEAPSSEPRRSRSFIRDMKQLKERGVPCRKSIFSLLLFF